MNSKVLGVIAGVVLAAVLFWPSGPGKVEEPFQKAEKLYEAGNYKDAIEKYNDALKESGQGSTPDAKLLYSEFSILVKYKQALCYSNIAEQGDVANYDVALSTLQEIYPKIIALKDDVPEDQKINVLEYQEGITYLYGHVFYKKGQYREAIPKFQELNNNFPNSQFAADALYEIGCAYYKLAEVQNKVEYQRKERKKAIDAFQELLDNHKDPNFAPDARFFIAQWYLEDSNWDKAKTEFTELIKETSTERANLIEEAKYRYAYCCLQSGPEAGESPEQHYEELLKWYEQFLEDYKDSKFLAAAHFDIGTIYFKQGSYDKAESSFQLASDSAKKDAETYSEMIPKAILGKAHSDYRQNGGLDEVTSYLADNREYFPAGHQLQHDYNVLLQNANNQVALDNIWDLPGQADELFEQAGELFKQEKYPEAAKKYEEAADIYKRIYDEPNTPELQEVYMLKFRSKFREGLSHFNASDFSESVKAYKEAIKYFNDNIKNSSNREYLNNCLYNLTVAYEKLEDWNSALTTYEKGIPEDGTYYEGIPKDSIYYEPAHHQLLVAMSRNDETAYLNVIKDATDSDKNIARINLAKLYLEAEPKRYADAYDLYAQVKGDVEAQYMAIVCYYNQIQNNAIEEVFRKLKANPNSVLVLPAYSAMMQIYGKSEKWPKMVELAKEVKQQFPSGDIEEEIKKKFPEADSNKVKELKESLANINKLYEYAKLKQEAGSTVDDKIEVLREIIKNSSAPKEKAKAQLKIGHLLYKARQYEVKDENDNLVSGAIYEYKKFMEDDSKFPKNHPKSTSDILIAKYQIASCYYQLGQIPEKPNDEKILYYGESVTAAQEILSTLHPDVNMQINIHYLLAMIKLSMMEIQNAESNRQEAITHFERVVELAKNRNDESSQRFTYGSNLRLAKLYWDAGNYESARDKYLYLIENNPDETREDKRKKVEAFYYLGLCYGEHLNDAVNAEKIFKDLWRYYNENEEIKEIGQVKQNIVDAGSRIAMSIAKNMDNEDLKNKAIDIVNQIDGIFPKYENCKTDEEKYRRIEMAHALGYILYKSIEKIPGSPPDEAITQFRKVIRYSNPPEEPNANEFINEAYYFAGQAAILLDVDSVPNKWNLAREEFLKKYVEKAPNGKYYQEALFRIAYTYYKEGIYYYNAQTPQDSAIPIQEGAIPLFEELIEERPGDVRLHFYLGDCYARVEPPRYLEALSQFHEVLNIDLNHERAPAALREIMVHLGQSEINLNEAVGQLTWLKNRHPAWAENKHPRLQGIKKVDEHENDTDEDIETDIDKVRFILDEEMITLYPGSEYAPQSYYNIGDYYSQVGGGYHKLYNQNYNSSDFDNAIKNYRIGHDFFKKRRLEEGIKRIKKPFVPLSTFEAARLIDNVDYASAINAYNSVIYLCIDIANLFPNLAAEMETELKDETRNVSISGIEDVKYKIPSISNPNSNSAPLSYYEAGLQRLDFGNKRCRAYNLIGASNVANKRQLFLYATIDYETAYDYFRKAYQHDNASDDQRRISEEKIQNLTDALVTFCIVHAEFLLENTNENTNYQLDAINAYNIAISLLKDVKNLFPDFAKEKARSVKDSIEKIPDSNGKAKLLTAIDEILE